MNKYDLAAEVTRIDAIFECRFVQQDASAEACCAQG